MDVQAYMYRKRAVSLSSTSVVFSNTTPFDPICRLKPNTARIGIGILEYYCPIPLETADI